MSDIFISYAKEDREKAKLLAEALAELGWSVFWDRQIPAGMTWREWIGKELGQARSVIVAWSTVAIDSSWVQEEADEARLRGILIPLRIEDVSPPIGFRSLQTADFIGWEGDSDSPIFLQLVVDLTRLLGPAPIAAEERSQAAPQAVQQTDEDAKPKPDQPAKPWKVTSLKTFSWLRRHWLPVTAAVSAGLALSVAAWLAFRPDGQPGWVQYLEQNGFRINPGFAAGVRPGALIQIAEAGPGETSRDLARPILLASAEQCFPDLKPGKSPFALPQSRGTGGGSLTLEGLDLFKALPGLQIGARAVKKYSAQISNPSLTGIPKGKLTEAFSKECVEIFDRVLAGGDKAEWFAVVIETVEADGATFVIEWETQTDAQSRLNLFESSKQALGEERNLKLGLDSANKTEMSAPGPLVIAYRYRPVEPVFEQ